MHLKKGILIFYLILITSSPFVWVSARNFSKLTPFKEKFITPNYYVFIDDVNTKRGEMIAAGIPTIIARVLVNKYTNYSYEVFVRYSNTFNPTYLFFSGDVSLLESTRSSGPIYLSFLIPLVFGIDFCLKKGKKLTLILFVLSPITASFLVKDVETIYRIPFFLMFIYLATLGFFSMKELKKFKLLMTFLVLLYFFEVARFLHDFYFHYPFRL